MLKEILSAGLGKVVSKIREAGVEILGGSNIDPAKQLEFEAKLRKIEAEESIAITQAAESVLLAETKSEDGYVRRTRPTFIYMMLVILANNFLIRPWLDKDPVVFPEALYYLFGAAILGYTGARSWDKMQPKWGFGGTGKK